MRSERTKKKVTRIRISAETDVSRAIAAANALAREIGFSETPQFMIATAVSELARNISCYAGTGEIVLRPVGIRQKKGIEVIARDAGPGIGDIGQALTEGFSTGGTLGFGLPGVRRLMDEFVFDERRRKGTKIRVRKWL